MDLAGGSIRQPVTVAVGVILMLIAGTLALTRIPIQLTPNVESTVISVSTFWEGASPEEMEQEVIDKQEERLQGLGGLISMTSTCQQSTGTIRLEFATGVDKNVALREVSDKLREVPEYPENVDEPVVSETDFERRDFIAWIVFGTDDPTLDIRELRDFALDRIEPYLERTEGVAEINVFGGREREVQIRVDPVLLAQRQISLRMMADAIRQTNRNVSAGQVAEGKRDLRVRTVSQYDSIESIERTVLRHTEAGPVLVRDVADVSSTFKEPMGFVRSRGQPVIAINAEREIGSNVIEVMHRLKARVAELNAEGGLLDIEAERRGLAGGLWLRQVYDQTVYIEDALALVRNNIWIGGALATLVLLLFLRSVRSVGIVALAIPISVVGAVVAMVAMGRSLNVISLAGMAFAVGMVVDNAIVVLENIFRHLEMGKPARAAAYDGAREVWGAVLASTLTTIVVFVPILLIQEEAGQLFRDIALAICAAVGLSLVVSMSVIPAAASRVLRPAAAGRERHTFAGAVGRLVYWLCGSWIARIAVIAVMTTVAVAGSLLLMPASDYLPRGNRNLVFGLLIPPPGYNLAQFESIADRMERTVRPFWEAGMLIDDPEAYETAVAKLPAVPITAWGSSVPTSEVVPPTLMNYFSVGLATEGILFQGAVSDDPKRVADLVPLMQHATRSEVLPGVFSIPFQVPLFQLGGASGSAVKIQLAGPDLDDVIAAASAVFTDLGARYGFGTVQPSPSNFNVRAMELQIVPDLVRLSELGLTAVDIGLGVQASGDGAIIGEYRVAGESIDLKVINRDAVGQQNANQLADLPIATPSGHVVSLSSVARVVQVGKPQEIARVGRQRAVTLMLTPPQDVPLEAVTADVAQLLDDLRARGMIAPAVQSTFAGSASKLAEVRRALLGDRTFIGTLGSSLVLSIIVVYLLMCVLFQSFVYPFVIMFSVPLATFGGFLALGGVHVWSLVDRYMPIQNLDVLTMLGFVLLVGVVVNNAILIVHQTLNFLQGRAGLPRDAPMTPRRAIAEAVGSRVRPIFMGMLTSVGGMLPLVLMPGSGSELYRGLGSVVVGGLIVSTVFTLLLVPLLLSLAFDLSPQYRAARAGAAPAERESAARPVATMTGTLRR